MVLWNRVEEVWKLLKVVGSNGGRHLKLLSYNIFLSLNEFSIVVYKYATDNYWQKIRIENINIKTSFKNTKRLW